MAEELDRWLHSIGLGRHLEIFRAHGVDLDVVGDLSEVDLKGLGLSLGDRKRLLRAVAALHGAEPGAKRSGAAERRYLTVLFCDLVGSTDLANRLDPEDVGAVISRYFGAVKETVSRFGGHTVRLLGDGVLVYFGWPHAHEDQIERAVTAGLEMAHEIGRLEVEPGAI
jgi:class 3 adenylate cyclase